MTKNLIVSLALSAGLASAAAAQNAARPLWSAYAGCWTQVAVEGQDVPPAGSSVCIVPTGNDGADLVSVANNKVVERTHIDADGAHHNVARQNCAGWEAANWSPDGRRLYFNSDQLCNGLRRVGAGLYAISMNGRLTNIVSVNAGGGQALRVLRYAPTTVDTTFPADVFAALAKPDMALGAARVASQHRVNVDDVIEASKSTNGDVVQAWVASADQKFDLDAKTLVRLADGGVAPATIDVMVAISNPSVFAVVPRESGVSATETEQPRVRAATDQRYDCYSQLVDPWGYGNFDYCDRRYGMSRYGAYGYDPYFSRYGYGYGYNSFGYGYYGGYFGGGPVVVVVKGDGQAAKHGRMTRDGYTTGSSSSSGGSSPSTSRTNPSSSSSPQSTSSSSGSSSSGSSSSGSSTTRVAHSKPPKG